MWGQMLKLRFGRHPKFGASLPTTVSAQGETLVDARCYSQLADYVPAVSQPLRPAGGRTVSELTHERLERVRAKVKAKQQAPVRRHFRGKKAAR